MGQEIMRLPPLRNLRVKNPNQASRNPCIGIMASLLSCWASQGYTVEGCGKIEEQLRGCMDAKNNVNNYMDEFKTVHGDRSVDSPGEVKILRNVPGLQLIESAPRKEVGNEERRNRLSFGGGNDGRGAPMFKNLVIARKHIMDGYDDQKPPEGFIGATFKRFVGVNRSSTVFDGK